jgi:endonuclease YncB( thermonuclease family)
MVRSIKVVCIAVLLYGCAQPHESNSDGKATVVRVVDGDTIVVHIGGHDDNVRLLGIDTPKP